MAVTEIAPFGEKAHAFAYRNPAQDKFLTILEGAIRTGKTFSFIPKILFQLCTYKVDGLRLIIGVSKNTIMDNLLRDLLDVAGEGNYHYNVTTGDLRLFGVDWIVMGAKDEGSEKYLRGKTVGIAIVEEGTLIPRSFFMQLMGRLSPRGARLYVNTNPDSPYHYLMKDVIENEALAKKIEVIHFDLDDNPNLPVSTRQRFETQYSGVFYERAILGRWVIAQGAIYRDALGPQCKFDGASKPNALEHMGYSRYIGVDYGTANACVFLDCWDDGRTIWQVREYYWDSRASGKGAEMKQIAQKTNEEYADDFDAFVGLNKRGMIVIVDPSAASFKITLVKRGYTVKDAKNDVLEGIRRTSSMLKMGRYRIHESCKMTLKELETYSWADKKLDKGEEEPVKQNDHSSDALRYIIETMVPKWRME